MNKKWAQERASYDSDGRAIIDMSITDDSEFLSPYSKHASPVISSDVAEFIEDSTSYFKPKQQFTLRIHSNCIDDGEKVVYENAIREYYAQHYIASKSELRFNSIIFILLTLVGAFALLLAFWVDAHIWSEMIDIAAWVFLWEAVDIFFFKRRKSNIERNRYLSYMLIKVEFLPLNQHEQK